MVVKDSVASRNWVVAMALPFSASMGTSTKDCLKVWTMVAPTGISGADILDRFFFGFQYVAKVKGGNAELGLN